MHLFYTPDITSETYTLSNEESKHCIKVLRLKIGDVIQLVDGKGSFYKTKIIDDNHKKCTVKVFEKQSNNIRKDYKTHIAAAPTKHTDRFETFLEKVTELGVDEISPLICRYSERKKINHERLEKVIISAVKQSLKPFKPKLNSLRTFKDFINLEFKGEKYIAHCYDSENKELLKTKYKKGENVLILIGPEGDFSKEEVKEALSKGFIEVSLSESRLRTETAGIAACHTIEILNY